VALDARLGETDAPPRFLYIFDDRE